MLEARLVPTKWEKLAARHLSEHTYRRLAAPAGKAMQPEAMGAPVAAEAALTGMVVMAVMAATEDITKAMFSDITKEKYPDLAERIKAYAAHAENGAEI